MNKFNLKGLEINDNDNVLTALAKGGLKGTVQGTLGFTALWGGVFIVGKLMNKVESKEDGAE